MKKAILLAAIAACGTGNKADPQTSQRAELVFLALAATPLVAPVAKT